jgi:hypothetical protein
LKNNCPKKAITTINLNNNFSIMPKLTKEFPSEEDSSFQFQSSSLSSPHPKRQREEGLMAEIYGVAESRYEC